MSLLEKLNTMNGGFQLVICKVDPLGDKTRLIDLALPLSGLALISGWLVGLYLYELECGPTIWDINLLTPRWYSWLLFALQLPVYTMSILILSRTVMQKIKAYRRRKEGILRRKRVIAHVRPVLAVLEKIDKRHAKGIQGILGPENAFQGSLESAFRALIREVNKNYGTPFVFQPDVTLDAEVCTLSMRFNQGFLMPAIQTPESQFDDVCAVCRLQPAARDFIARLRCKHYFHSECLPVWFATSETCPLCGKSISDPKLTCSVEDIRFEYVIRDEDAKKNTP